MISEHAVLSYLAEATTRGWGVMTSGSLALGWHLVYQSRLHDYDVFLDVDEDWVYMQCPLLRAEASPACKPFLNEYLLRANDCMYLAKLTLVQTHTSPPADWVALTTECPAEAFNASFFRLMTEAVAKYVEEHDQEVLAIAFDPAIAALVTDGGVEDREFAVRIL